MPLHQDLRKYFMDRLLRQVSYEYMQYKFYKLLFRYRKPKILFITEIIDGILLAQAYNPTSPTPVKNVSIHRSKLPLIHQNKPFGINGIEYCIIFFEIFLLCNNIE